MRVECFPTSWGARLGGRRLDFSGGVAASWLYHSRSLVCCSWITKRASSVLLLSAADSCITCHVACSTAHKHTAQVLAGLNRLCCEDCIASLPPAFSAVPGLLTPCTIYAALSRFNEEVLVGLDRLCCEHCTANLPPASSAVPGFLTRRVLCASSSQ